MLWAMAMGHQAACVMVAATMPATPRPRLTNPISYWNPFVCQPI